MMELVRLMQTPVGRAARVALGVVLIAVGLILGGGWLTLAIVGAVPIIAGSVGLCLLAPLFRAPIRVVNR
jgi:Protein of unknown function (DUF2892)